MFQIVKDKFRKHPNKEVLLPKKGSHHAVGVDFCSMNRVAIAPKRQFVFWTDLKVKLNRHEFLMILPRSSVGIKKSLMLANTVGIIDPDYYGNESNDGNIGICMYNYGTKDVFVDRGERIAQGICVLIRPMNVPSLGERKGGIGSSG